MSLTKRQSPDGCGGDRDPDYEEWSDSLDPIDEDDVEAMYADYVRRKEGEGETERT